MKVICLLLAILMVTQAFRMTSKVHSQEKLNSEVSAKAMSKYVTFEDPFNPTIHSVQCTYPNICPFTDSTCHKIKVSNSLDCVQNEDSVMMQALGYYYVNYQTLFSTEEQCKSYMIGIVLPVEVRALCGCFDTDIEDVFNNFCESLAF
nr:pheromone protein [Euplotes aediculatus]